MALHNFAACCPNLPNATAKTFKADASLAQNALYAWYFQYLRLAHKLPRNWHQD
jgi:hypothetical protein